MELLGKVGPDDGEFGVRSHLREVGVEVTRIDTASEPTGTAYVFVEQDADNRIIVRPGANSAIGTAYVQAQYDTIRSAECLLLQNEIPVAPVVTLLSELAAARDRPTVVLDPAPADGVEALLECDAVDYLTPNETEYRALRSALGKFDGVLIRKRGADDVAYSLSRTAARSAPRGRAC